ncbi:hypothetical protein J2Z69_001363 [Paenibacillus shirakamiensis]|uniref:Uncharacterized protein n=1 Tax=Paenibacillus shirakamiensis TaxID=1265935 RepID=A0ABS4JF59_9BACL|nr:hypothetical protein [Paenibacillus shirakamiensis]MBP2000344.1 hypothetical protein [Paenibacillus shirakamiensis]
MNRRISLRHISSTASRQPWARQLNRGRHLHRELSRSRIVHVQAAGRQTDKGRIIRNV